jgi:hypothetical protein
MKKIISILLSISIVFYLLYQPPQKYIRWNPLNISLWILVLQQLGENCVIVIMEICTQKDNLLSKKISRHLILIEFCNGLYYQ